MNHLRSTTVIMMVLFAASLLVHAAANAQGGGKSLAELTAQAQKIKIGATEAEVIALMGQPAKIKEDVKASLGGRKVRERKLLSYGPNNEIVIVILKDTGMVGNIKYAGQQ
jgi:hypothetical protein